MYFKQIISSRAITPLAFIFAGWFGSGIYAGMGVEISLAFEALQWLGILWAIVWWLQKDDARFGLKRIPDLGFFLSLLWPIFVPCYLIKTRGWRVIGNLLLILLMMLCAYFAGFGLTAFLR